MSSQGIDLSDPEEMSALQAAIQAVNDEENSANSYQLDLSGISNEVKTRAWAMNFVKIISKVAISTILLSICIGFLEETSQTSEEISYLGTFSIGLSITSIALIFS